MGKIIRKKRKSRQQNYQHLTIEDRESIMCGIAAGKSKYEIARMIKRSPSTICREIRRNSAPIYQNCYAAHRAELRSEVRWKTSHSYERIRNPLVRRFVIKKLKLNWTPELIAGRLPIELPGLSTNHESIYQYIYEDRPDLIHKLPFSHRKRRKRGSAKGKRGLKIIDRVMITKRPAVVNSRKRFGDWETDTAVSRESQTCLGVMVERKGRYMEVVKMPTKESKPLMKMIANRLNKFPKAMRRTITNDNGLENADHKTLSKKTGAKVYFCNPYHSWEKGTVEQTIGLLRRYWPKKTDFSKISQAEINRVQSALNNRPRKCLNFKTPNEVFALAY